MWQLVLFFSDITPSFLPGYQQGGDNSSTSITAGKIDPLLHFVFAAFGAIALIVIVLAGIQYILSQGEPQKVAKAKDTILYALIGLVVSISAYAIVSYVVNWLT